jgi:3-deoxy-D-manno-octulosonic-acid transferase
MVRIYLFLYSVLLFIADLILSVWPDKKLKAMFSGRKETKSKAMEVVSKKGRPVWIHCASLGEFEQGRPVIEALKKSYPGIPLILSFFSPSGYEMRSHFPYADAVVYLPSDSPAHARWMVHDVRPLVFIFVKYEFWWNLIFELERSDIKTLLISGTFRSDNYFFHPFLKPLKRLIKGFDALFIQDEQSAQVLRSQHILNFAVAGDTRIDRVLENASQARIDNKWFEWKGNKKVFIYGSIWDSDMHVVRASVAHFSEDLHVIVPHDVDEDNVTRLCHSWKDRVSYWNDEVFRHDIVMVNTIGLLNSLYLIADFVYVGGGFQKGIHNILEPASYGIPVFFGPRHTKFFEATQLKACGQGYDIENFEDMKKTVEELLHDPAKSLEISEASHHFFQSQKGATEKILTYLEDVLKLKQ